MQNKVLVSSKTSVEMSSAPLIKISLTAECGVDDEKLSDLSQHLRKGRIVIEQTTTLTGDKRGLDIFFYKGEE